MNAPQERGRHHGGKFGLAKTPHAVFVAKISQPSHVRCSREEWAIEPYTAYCKVVLFAGEHTVRLIMSRARSKARLSVVIIRYSFSSGVPRYSSCTTAACRHGRRENCVPGKEVLPHPSGLRAPSGMQLKIVGREAQVLATLAEGGWGPNVERVIAHGT